MTQMLAMVFLVTLLALMMGLAGCGKKQAETDIESDTAPRVVPEEVVEVPADDIPVVDETPAPAEVETPRLALEPVFFDFDKFDLRADAREALNSNGRQLKEHGQARIIIEGHCDERGTVQYNLALGEKRARAARDYLLSLGIVADRIEIVSYGKERPFASGHDEEAWRQNRRAHFVQR